MNYENDFAVRHVRVPQSAACFQQIHYLFDRIRVSHSSKLSTKFPRVSNARWGGSRKRFQEPPTQLSNLIRL